MKFVIILNFFVLFLVVTSAQAEQPTSEDKSQCTKVVNRYIESSAGSKQVSSEETALSAQDINQRRSKVGDCAIAKEIKNTLEQCTKEVNTYLDSIVSIKQQSGEETKPFGITAKDVNLLRAKDGDCVTAKLIRKGMWKSSLAK